MFEAYFTAFPGIKGYFEKQEKEMWEKGYILIDIKSGMRSYIPNWEEFKWLDDNKNNYEGIWEIYKEGKSRFNRNLSVEISFPDILETIKLMQKGFSILDIGVSLGKPYQDLIYSSLRAMFKLKSSYSNKSANMPSQGSSAHMTKCALINYYKSLINRGKIFNYLIINVIHDEALIEVPEENAEEEAKILKECMENASSYFCTHVKIKASPEIGNHWIH